ncbi:MAG TPA: hypothetical protein VNL77_23975, partial [Roseiflexaceae bacterium]|nr:hypothetical protein [Roseiflexaceae bacterium]
MTLRQLAAILRPAAPQRAALRLPRLSGRPALQLALLAAALTLLLALAEAAGLGARRPMARVDMAAPEAALVVRGFHAPERDGARGFRWSAGASEVRLLGVGVGGVPVLGLRLGAAAADRPAPGLTVGLGG